MKAVAKTRFRDLEAGVTRDAGEEFECTEKRLAEINSTKWGVLAEAKAPARRRAAKKAE